MKDFKTPLALTTAVLALSLTACGGNDTPSPTKELRPAATANVAVNVMASVDAFDEADVKAVDPTLTSPVVTELSSEEDYIRTSRDKVNPLHSFATMAFYSENENAARYATFEEFKANRAGEFQQVDAKGYSWAYVGQEADYDKHVPLAGLVARADDGAIYVCTWSGNYAKNADAAVADAKKHLEAMKEACAVQAS